MALARIGDRRWHGIDQAAATITKANTEPSAGHLHQRPGRQPRHGRNQRQARSARARFPAAADGRARRDRTPRSRTAARAACRGPRPARPIAASASTVAGKAVGRPRAHEAVGEPERDAARRRVRPQHVHPREVFAGLRAERRQIPGHAARQPEQRHDPQQARRRPAPHRPEVSRAAIPGASTTGSRAPARSGAPSAPARRLQGPPPARPRAASRGCRPPASAPATASASASPGRSLMGRRPEIQNSGDGDGQRRRPPPQAPGRGDAHAVERGEDHAQADHGQRTRERRQQRQRQRFGRGRLGAGVHQTHERPAPRGPCRCRRDSRAGAAGAARRRSRAGPARS